MKLLLSILLLAAAAGAQTALAPTDPPQDESAKKAHALLAQAIQALGGEAYLNYQDLQVQGRAYIFYHGQAEGGGTPFWSFWKAPDKERVELTKQRDVIYIHSGDKGYEITYKGTSAEEEKELKDYLQQREFSLVNIFRHWIHQPDVAFFYEGSTFAENKPVEQVSLLNSKSQGVTLLLDSETHLPVRKSYTLRDPETHDRNEEAEVYANYHMVQGIQTPFDLTRLHNGEMSRQRFIQRASYNNNLPDSLFDARITYTLGEKKHK
jgi:hypothetical protein